MEPEPVSAIAPPLPTAWIVSQRWRWVSFLHWRVPAETVARFMPRGTRPDVHDGSSWVGLVPFHLSSFTVRSGPALPYVGVFPEINVRLYSVDEAGRRGVVFLSLDAARVLAVLGARVGLALPYAWASMRMRVDTTIEYSSRRLTPRHPRTFISVRPLPGLIEHDPLADFLTARWGLHTRSLGATRYLPMAHEPWRLQPAELVALDDELVAAAGLPGIATRPPDSVLCSAGVTARFAQPTRAVD